MSWHAACIGRVTMRYAATRPTKDHPPLPADRAGTLLPPCFFAAAVAFFAGALLLLPFVTATLADHFYHPSVLAVTHMLTLGWISMAMVGVLYRYVPGLTKHPLPWPRLAVLQCATFVIGVAGLVAHFALGNWTGTASAAGVVLVSIALLCANLWPLLLRAPGRGVAEVGLLVATGAFALAAALGTLLALDKGRSLLGGSLLPNLSAHAHLAAVGWVGVTICALSFRFLPAFLLPTADVSRAARRQVVLLAGGVALLVVMLLSRSPFVPVAVLPIVVAIVAYLRLLGRVVGSRRLPLDWTARHALASAVWLAASLAGGIGVAFLGGDDALGARVAAAYGVAGILGWMSNILIGVSYKLFVGFVSGARAERGRPPVPMDTLAVPASVQPAVFALFNAGAALTAGGLVAGSVAAATAGAVVLAAGGVLYAAVTARTLSFTVLDPRRPVSPLAVLP